MRKPVIAAVCAAALFALFFRPLSGGRLRTKIASAEDGAAFTPKELYGNDFDSVYLYGPYARIEAPGYDDIRYLETA